MNQQRVWRFRSCDAVTAIPAAPMRGYPTWAGGERRWTGKICGPASALRAPKVP